MNQDKKTKHIVLFLTLQTVLIDFDKIDNLKFNQILDDFYTDFKTLLIDFAVGRSLHVKEGVIITWDLQSGVSNLNCLRLPIAFQQLINTKSNYYHSRYGLTPKMCAVENIYEFEDVEWQWREKAHIKEHLSELITLSNLSKASGKPFLVSGNVTAAFKKANNFQKVALEFNEIPTEDLPISVYSVEPIKHQQ